MGSTYVYYLEKNGVPAVTQKSAISTKTGQKASLGDTDVKFIQI